MPGAIQPNGAKCGMSKSKLQKNAISQGFNLLIYCDLDHAAGTGVTNKKTRTSTTRVFIILAVLVTLLFVT